VRLARGWKCLSLCPDSRPISAGAKVAVRAGAGSGSGGEHSGSRTSRRRDDAHRVAPAWRGARQLAPAARGRGAAEACVRAGRASPSRYPSSLSRGIARPAGSSSPRRSVPRDVPPRLSSFGGYRRTNAATSGAM
jgi:hypothetical protein